MSRFNEKKHKEEIRNLAGAKAYAQSAVFELIAILFTSFAGNSFYRSDNDTMKRLVALTLHIPLEVTVRAIVFARRVLGMRSITHVAAAAIAPLLSGNPIGWRFYRAVVHRPDDMTEIASLVNCKLTAAMKKGFARAFDSFDDYQIAKYKGSGNKVKLVDIVNMVHPTPTEGNAESLRGLISGNLTVHGTWENELSEAGSDADKKAEVWRSLILHRRIGYFALLRNVRNIIDQADDHTFEEACMMLENPGLIKESMVLPFRFWSAYKALMSDSNRRHRTSQALSAISRAADIALSNIPSFTGRTLVVLDVSSSMTYKNVQETAALFACSILKANPRADFITFDHVARYEAIDTSQGVINMARGVKFTGGGTDFRSIFGAADKPYDRMIIISDMQGWVGDDSPKLSYDTYVDCRCGGVRPYTYFFDLAGYGTTQLPEKNIIQMSGFSEKVFELMPLLEQAPDAILETIKSVEL